MVHFLNKLFNIRTNEWPSVLFLFFMAFLTFLVSFWGITIAYAAFLKQLGIEALPWVLIWSSVFSVFAIAVYTAFADRISDNRLMMGIYAISALCIISGLAMLWSDLVILAFPFLYLFDFALNPVFDSHFTTYANSFYDIQSAKRTLPVVFAGFRVAIITGGLTMPLVIIWFGPSVIFVIWLLTYLAITGLVWFMPRVLKRAGTHVYKPGHTSPVRPVHPGKEHHSHISNMLEGFRYIVGSAYLRWMMAGTLSLIVLIVLIEYRTCEILLKMFDTPGEFASFLALLLGVANIIALPVLLFVISRVIARLGLGNAILIFPTGNLLICSCLIFAPGLVSAAAAHIDRTAFLNACLPIDGLLYNAVPVRIRGRIRAFAGGLLTPLGTIAGSLLLLIPAVSEIWWIIPTLIGILASAYMFSAFVIRKLYSQALVEMLEHDDYSFLLSQEASDLSVTDPATLRSLEQKLKESTEPQFTIFMAKLISQTGTAEAAEILARAVETAEDPGTRAAIADVISASNMSGRMTEQLYTGLISDPSGSVRQAALAGLEQLAGPDSKAFREFALKALHDSETEVCIQAFSGLARSGNFYHIKPAVEALEQILGAKAPDLQAKAVRVLGQIKDPRALETLISYLDHPADEVRLRAVIATEIMTDDLILAEKHVRALSGQMPDLLSDPVERIRQASLIILSHINSKRSQKVIISKLTDTSQQVRLTAADILVKTGKSAIPALHSLLDSPDSELRKMCAVVLARISEREFGSLVSAHITGNLLTIYQNHFHLEALLSYTDYSGIVVLRGTLCEENQRLLDEIYYLLSATHGSDAIKIISESLCSNDPHIRANASEALEALTTPQTARLVTPLSDPDIEPGYLLKLGQEAWEMEYHDGMEVIGQFITEADNSWIRAVMLFTLGEMMNGACGQQYDMTLLPFKSLKEIDDILYKAVSSPENDVRQAAGAAMRMIAGLDIVEFTAARFAVPMADELQHGNTVHEEEFMLSSVEKIIFLKKVPFFQGMTIDQLRTLAPVCEEEFFEEDSHIFEQGDPGGVLYIVVNGKVGVERAGKRKGSSVRLATIEAHSYFGEMDLFDNSSRSASAIALQDTLTLRIRREPLMVLFRQHPDLSLELINVLSQRLREADDKIAGMTRTKPRELHKLFDQF